MYVAEAEDYEGSSYLRRTRKVPSSPQEYPLENLPTLKSIPKVPLKEYLWKTFL